ncbi:MAG TPA: alpha/beta family hydrolase [Streptosporangiaceae bacterium]
MEIGTTHGPAQVTVEYGDDLGSGQPAFLLALTHGSGGDTGAPDLMAVRDVAIRLGGAVARITQPYRVRGARAPGSAIKQDEAWVEIIAALREKIGLGCPLVQGGRSNGARVACRTAGAVDAAAVIALAFPLHPPGQPDRSRAAELRMPGRAIGRGPGKGSKVLVVNGDRDPFGVPGRRTGVRVVVLAGETHALSRRPAAVGDAVARWLPRVLGLEVPANSVHTRSFGNRKAPVRRGV